MTDGLRWIRQRSFWAGGPEDPDDTARTTVDARDFHRDRLRPGQTRSVWNMGLRLSDGALVKRDGIGSFDNAQFKGKPQQMLDFVRPSAWKTAGNCLLISDWNGMVGLLNQGFEASSDEIEIRWLNKASGTQQTTGDQPPNEAAGGLPERRLVVFNNVMAAFSHGADPWVWTGESSSQDWVTGPTTYPSAHVYDAFPPVGALLFDRRINNYHSVEPGAGPNGESGPFQPADRAFYVFAFEIGKRFGFVPGFQDPGGGKGATPSGRDIPACALELTYNGAGADGSLKVPTPLWPIERKEIAAVRIYRSRIYTDAADPPPLSLADFFFLGRVIISGANRTTGQVSGYTPSGSDFFDNFSDDELLGEQPFGPPLALFRGLEVVEHNNRLVVGNLKSPRAAFSFVSGIPSGGTISVWVNAATVNASPWHVSHLEVEISNANDRTYFGFDGLSASTLLGHTSYKFKFSPNERLADAVQRFNRELEAIAPKVNGRKVAAVRMVLHGDDNLRFSSNDPTSDFNVYPDTTISSTAGTSTEIKVSDGGIAGEIADYSESRLLNFTWDNVEALNYESEIYVTDIANPWVYNPFLRFATGEAAREEIVGLAKFRHPSGRQEVLIGKRDSLYRLTGTGIEVAGVIDYGIQEVSKVVGFFHLARLEEGKPSLWAESPEGVYFASHRTIDYFDGTRVRSIPIADDFKTDIMESLAQRTADLEDMALGWYDGRLFFSGKNRLGNSIVYVYDERIARQVGDPRASWVRWGITSPSASPWVFEPLNQYGCFATWNRRNGPMFMGGMANSVHFLLSTDDAAIRTKDANISVDNAKFIGSAVTLATVQPDPDRRVLFRAVRPRIRKLGADGHTLNMLVRIDDRSEIEIDISNRVAKGAADDSFEDAYVSQPLIWIGRKRGRRIEVGFYSDDQEKWELLGCDIGFTSFRGGKVGAFK